MGGVSFRTSVDMKPDASVVNANKATTTDRVVDTSNKATFTQDFKGAVEAAKKSGANEIFFKGDDNVVHKLPLDVNSKSIDDIMGKINANPDFVLSNTITFKPAGTSVIFKGEVKTADQTLEKSNANASDKVWDFMNGGATSVNPSTKPEAFKNSIQLGEDGSVKVIGKGDKDVTGEMEGFPKTKADFQKLIVKDFNFNGAISKFNAAGGESTFVQEMKNNHPDAVKKMGEENFDLLCKNVFSYAKTGHDLNGKTDIGDMQGMLRQLNPKILDSSDSNTKMAADGVINKTAIPKGKEDNYVVIGDKAIPRGDDKYGRATILTTRQLGDSEAANKSDISTVNLKPPGTKYDLAINFSDKSSSTDFMRKAQTAQQNEKLKDGNWETVVARDFGKNDGRGEMKESAVLAYTKELSSPNSAIAKLQPGDKALVTSFVDTNDSTSLADLNALKAKVADLKSKDINVDVKFTFGNVEIDLNDIKPEHFKNATGTSENLKWADIAMPKFKEMDPAALVKSVTLIEGHTSFTPELKQLVIDKLKTLDDNGINALMNGVMLNSQVSDETKKFLQPMFKSAMAGN
jgi:hypothetical protein